MVDTILDVQDVFKIYETVSNVKVTALRGISVSLNEGTILGVYGPSGAGKTTLINILGGLETVSSGEIIYYSSNQKFTYSKLNKIERNFLLLEEFGFLFQLPSDNLFPALTAEQNILLPLKMSKKFTRSEQILRVKDLLKSVDLLDRAHHKPFQLSGGEAQRLGVAIALANDPKLVFCDEPTGELDTFNKISLLKFIKKLNEDLGKTFVIVSHDRRVTNITDRQIFILNGSISSTYIRSLEKKPDRGVDTVISPYGEIEIPLQFLQTLTIGKIAMIKVNLDEKALIIEPTNQSGNETKNQMTNKKPDYIQISNEGKIIIPGYLREKANISERVNISLKKNQIEIKGI